MRLHDLTVGQRFSFIDKHRGKVFEVTVKRPGAVQFKDVATGEIRNAWANRKTFRMEVELVTEDRVVSLNEREQEILIKLLHGAYLHMCEQDYSEPDKSEINQLYLKISGKPGRRRDFPED